MNAWQTLFFPCTPQVEQPQQIADILAAALTTFGYKRYDPFTSLSLEAFAKAVRVFISPILAGAGDSQWIRVGGELDAAFLTFISQRTPLVLTALSDDGCSVRLWDQHGEHAEPEALTEYLRDGVTLDDMISAMTMTVANAQQPEADLPTDALPDDIRHLAGGVDMNHANRLFARLSETLSNKAGADSDENAAARQLLRGTGPNWNSLAAARLTAAIACLKLPEGWRAPDFVALRDAYALRKRLQRNPAAIMLPGDAETLSAVPNALDYIPVYGGKQA